MGVLTVAAAMATGVLVGAGAMGVLMLLTRTDGA